MSGVMRWAPPSEVVSFLPTSEGGRQQIVIHFMLAKNLHETSRVIHETPLPIHLDRPAHRFRPQSKHRPYVGGLMLRG